MTRGCREGKLTKADFVHRLASFVIERLQLDEADHSTTVKLVLDELYSRDALYGHAHAHGLLSDLECRESCPQTTSTVPCYLYTHVANAKLRDAIEKYVLAASMLFLRGSDIVNIIITSLQTGVDDLDPFRSAADGSLDTAITFITNCNTLKQCFLPERWPTDGVPRHSLVDGARTASNGLLDHLLPDWQAVMLPTGWDNVLNRMASKYLANVKVMVQANIARRCGDYAVTVLTRRHAFEFPLEDALQAFQQAVRSSVEGRPRPLVIHNQEYTLLYQLRHVLGCRSDNPTQWPSQDPPFSDALLKLHIVMAGVMKHERMPTAKRGRTFAYLDDKVLNALLSRAFEGDKKNRKNAFADASLSAVFGVEPNAYNQTRRYIRRGVRRRYRRRHGREQGCRDRRRLRKKWRRLGRGSLPKDARVHSVETDGVGLRLVIQRPDKAAIARLVSELNIATVETVVARVHDDGMSPKKAVQSVKAELPKVERGVGKPAAPLSEQWRLEDTINCRDRVRPPAFGGVDTGRVKILTTAVTPSAVTQPSTLVLTRKRYYAAMRHWRRQRWDRERASVALVKTALEALSNVALSTTDSSPLGRLLASKAVEAQWWSVLFQEYVVDKGRALWKMRTLRRKKACLDRACSAIVRTATAGDMTRDLVIGVGDAGFASTGPGELSAPTSSVTKALRRLKCRRDAVQSRGGGRTALLSIPEYKTTVCCCACGAETSCPEVKTAQGMRPSRRLRACTSCDKTRCRLRDRDVQAARNMLWLTLYMFYGLERPWYMCRSQTASRDRSTS